MPLLVRAAKDSPHRPVTSSSILLTECPKRLYTTHICAVRFLQLTLIGCPTAGTSQRQVRISNHKRPSRKLWGRVSTLRTTFASQKERWPAGPPRGLERLREPSLQELSKLRGGLELWDRIECLECRGERIRETPNGPRFELLVLRLEVEVVNRTREVFGSFQLGFDERFVDDHLGGDIREFTSLPGFDLFSHGLEVPLHPVNPDR